MKKRTLVGAACVAAWLSVVAAAFVGVERYGTTAGDGADSPAAWPAASRVPRTPGRATLVMIAHARCPCTRASLRELERLVARTSGEADATVVFEGPPPSDARDDLRKAARRIAGVHVVEDPRGDEARRFGAKTSGQVVLYDAAGALRFSGGITPSRGHEGDNAGSDAILESLHAPASRGGSLSHAGVFGCSLFSRKETP